MKLMVTGVGAVGGYIAAVLSAYDNGTVTLVARNARLAALKQNGLVIHSERMGERIFHPIVINDPAAAGIQDIIFICVKNYSLQEAVQAIAPCVASHTIIVPILNGVDHGEVTRSLLPTGTVLDALTYITAASNADFSFSETSSYARVIIGSPDTKANQLVFTLLNHPEMECIIADDIEAELWNKYIVNCAYNTITAYYTKQSLTKHDTTCLPCTTRGIMTQPGGMQNFHTLLEEAAAVALAKPITLPEGLVEEIYSRFAERRTLDATSSMARDVLAGRPTELETFSGYLVRLADRLHVPVPLSARLYDELKACLN